MAEKALDRIIKNNQNKTDELSVEQLIKEALKTL